MIDQFDNLQDAIDDANSAARIEANIIGDFRQFLHDKGLPDALTETLIDNDQKAREYDYLIEKVEQWLAKHGFPLPAWHGRDLGRSVRAAATLQNFDDWLKGKQVRHDA